ncbi:MAG: dihydrofolate reductase family protein [Pseudonocardia sp.]|nr:dihydrofolate reductase family protein [Pseudonocardia sp.]
MSLDGYIDDAAPATLVLSDAEDLDRVDGVRAGVDAVLVGAGTVRADDPRLLVRSASRRRERTERGRSPSPLRVVLTAGGDLDPSASLFGTGTGISGRVVYAARPAVSGLRARLGDSAEVVDAGDPPGLPGVLADLAARGVARLLVEGGGAVHSAFLAAGAVDEIHAVVAPFLVGDGQAPRFVRPGTFPQDAGHPMTLAETRAIGDRVLLRYRIGDPDRRLLTLACDLAERCPPSDSAFSAGAVVVGEDGEVLATGHSRAGSPLDHAVEVALSALRRGDPRLAGATLYSTLEPCRTRASRPVACARHILDAGLSRVVTARRGPATVDGRAAAALEDAGVQVVEIPDLAPLARRPNAHLLR